MGSRWTPGSKFLIYGLLDPFTNRIRYVGKSCSGLKRPQRHTSPCELRFETHKNRWVRSVLARGGRPQIRVLCYCQSRAEVDRKEIEFIARWRVIERKLTNSTDGGEGIAGYRHAEETIRRISESNKRTKRLCPQVPYQRSTEGKKASSVRAKKRLENLEERIKIAVGRGCQPFRDTASGVVYRTHVEASVALGISRKGIQEMLSGRNKSVCGYVFEKVDL